MQRHLHLEALQLTFTATIMMLHSPARAASWSPRIGCWLGAHDVAGGRRQEKKVMRYLTSSNYKQKDAAVDVDDAPSRHYL